MGIDFLDRLEADLREAAERRGQPSPRRRRPNPRPALRALAVAVVRLGGGLPKAAVATTGDASSLDLFVQRLENVAGFRFIAPPNGRPALADPSLGSVVLYGDASQRLGEEVARSLGIDRSRPLTAADEAKINFDVRDANVVVVFGPDLQERTLAQSGNCTPAGHLTSGDLSLCETNANGGVLTGFLVDGRRLPVDAMQVRGHWLWAAASPDGKTILADWTGECEVPQTFLIDAARGKPQPVTGSGSEAYGWTTDGRAIVARRPGAGCSDGSAPGLYLVTPEGEATLVGKAVPRGLKRTIAPRDVQEIIGRAGP